MFEEKKHIVYFIILSLNWIFGLLFLYAGIDAFADTKVGGLAFILIALLLLPPARYLVFSKTQKEIKLWQRSLYISVLFISFVFFNVTGGTKQQSLHLEAKSTVPENSIRQDQGSRNFAANKPTSMQTKSIKKENLPVKVAQIQSTSTINSIKQDSKSRNTFANQSTGKHSKYTEDNLSGKAVLIQTTNTKQANQIKNNKSESEIKTNEILAKLKNIPVSQYEQNRSLYQQLVDFNPGENKYKKKLSFYSQKIKQQSCKNININKTVDYSPDWLSANGHCLSNNQKKKMEIALFKKVKKISSKKIIQNWEGYKSLSILNPNNKSYLNKLKHYQNKLKVRTANS